MSENAAQVNAMLCSNSRQSRQATPAKNFMFINKPKKKKKYRKKEKASRSTPHPVRTPKPKHQQKPTQEQRGINTLEKVE